ncbi:MAG: hypothetical protein DRJ42_21215 [Deltaproteobacteria bacterium]|nr:MAG: hypothetical protein DRJ42_21215 [Deltaproteobacteria bacterium]
MRVSTVTTRDHALLHAVRGTISAGDEVLLCVAFAHVRGVQLIRKELEAAAKRAAPRLLVTTAFGQSHEEALAAASNAGAEVRVLNPGTGTYHPKLYLSSRGSAASGVIGSANLTSGLVVNVEVGTHLEGERTDPALADAWSWAETMWEDPRAKAWEAEADVPGKESFDAELLRLLQAAVAEDPVFYTLGKKAPNRVSEVTAGGLYVETARSTAKHGHGELVPPWMVNLAWEVLRSQGELTNKELLEELRVHRSSAVMAILSRLPNVEALPGRRVGVRWVGGGVAAAGSPAGGEA